MNISFKIPEFDQLMFRQYLMSDENTMLYNKKYGGTIPFPKENWEPWYKRWILDNSNDCYYRYIFDEDINKFIGEVYYYKDKNENCYNCGIIILYEYRNKGYGKKALSMLCNVAKQNGIVSLFDSIGLNNPSLHMFLKFGFKICYQNDEFIRVKLNL